MKDKKRVTRPITPNSTVRQFRADISSPSAAQILIVVDKPSLRRLLHATLFAEGFDVSEASNAEEAIALCRIVKYDGILLDADMPGKGGIQTCVDLQMLNPRLAVLMLSASDDHEQMVAALESGADDFIIVPCRTRELSARLRATLRRTQAPASNRDDTISIGDVSLHPVHRVVKKGDSHIYLTPREFSLLHYLMAHAGPPIPHSRLLHAVWGAEFTAQVEYLRTYIRQLRQKLEDDVAHPDYLLTESHFGYRFIAADEWDKAKCFLRTKA